MKYILSDLLKVRNFRVDAAMRKVVESRENLQHCQQQRTVKQQELDNYVRYRLAREQSLYDEIFGRTIKLATLEELKDKVRSLRFEQTAYEQQLLDAQRALDSAIESLRDAQMKHHQSLRAEEKLKQHHQLWMVDAHRNQTLKEDAECEDIPVSSLQKLNARSRNHDTD